MILVVRERKDSQEGLYNSAFITTKSNRVKSKQPKDKQRNSHISLSTQCTCANYHYVLNSHLAAFYKKFLWDFFFFCIACLCDAAGQHSLLLLRHELHAIRPVHDVLSRARSCVAGRQAGSKSIDGNIRNAIYAKLYSFRWKGSTAWEFISSSAPETEKSNWCL